MPYFNELPRLDDASAQPGLESSSQAFEWVNFLIKAFESENGS